MVKYPTGTTIKYQKRKSLNIELPKPQTTKYGNKHVTIDGITFDSQLEAKYYLYLKTLKINFKYHETFEILPKFEIAAHKIRKAIYTPDFSIYTKNELTSVVDTKGGQATMTDASRLRMKLFMHQYHVPVVIATWNKETKTFNEEIK